MFNMGAGETIASNHCPVIAQDIDIGSAHVNHRLDCQYQSLFQHEIMLAHFGIDEVGNLGIFVHDTANAVAYVLIDDTETRTLDMLLHQGRNFRPPLAAPHLGNGDLQRLFSHLDKPVPFGTNSADNDRRGGIGAPAVELTSRVDLDKVPIADGVLAGYAVNNLIIKRDARHRGKGAPSDRDSP